MVETALQAELALGGCISAFLSEAVRVNANAPRCFQRQPL
jgi:hypothetical protein